MSNQPLVDLQDVSEDVSKKNKDFVQYRRSGMKYFRKIIKDNPLAAQIFSFLTEHMDYKNVVVCSSKVLEEYFDVGRTSVYKAIKYLDANSFLIIGKTGTTSVFTVNPEIAWTTHADKKRFCEFNGKVILSESENKDLELKAKKFKELMLKSNHD